MDRSVEKVLQMVRKFAGYEDMPEYVKLREDGMVDVAGGFDVGTYEELKDEDEEKIKERLRKIGYLS